ncbi:MAG: proline dehydrogenase [Candidatus Fraserbacteria bacterium RBG_16_55_9]|uniref:proline dehydrogenase n=1 Tax=Fraserbacteria sp. (strain RBG_16_55_9) TaxID=1817864 RepID=A0A1F5UUF5_FRAXR|nr:MAG: proline dehydrogenase [Candidatus Fraserbacteria bacterium RBG_16_55_9]
MLRHLLLGLSRSDRARALVLKLPLSRRAARRFVAGETLGEAIDVVQRLNEHGILATLDHLGENTHTREEAIGAAREYLHILDAIHKDELGSHASLKLTQMGLDLGDELCLENLTMILERAKRYGNFVRIDMESSAHTERTIQLYERLRDAGYAANMGIVLQAYLHRSRRDIERLITLGGNVRLCKGAYAEPPAVAFSSKQDVDRNYVELLKLLWSSPALESSVYTAVATHDERILQWARRFTQTNQIPKDRFEFQMLYGIRRDLQDSLARDGYRVRVYVSYGQEWYPYFMRRLAERPANVLFLARHLLRR